MRDIDGTKQLTKRQFDSSLSGFYAGTKVGRQKRPSSRPEVPKREDSLGTPSSHLRALLVPSVDHERHQRY